MSSRRSNGAEGTGDALENLTPAEKEYLRGCLPTEAQHMVSWAMPVLAAPAFARATLVAAQIEVLEPFWDDPEAWCREALELARAEKAARHG